MQPKMSEAEVAYSLYCTLWNAIKRGVKVKGVEFTDVKPEYPITCRGPLKRADLMVFARIGASEPRPFLLIEVKEKNVYGTRAYDKGTEEQAKNYIKIIEEENRKLMPIYFAVCDGNAFVLFKAGTKTRVGEPYEMELSEDFARKLLEALVHILYHQVREPPFPRAKKPDDLRGERLRRIRR
jgi:hypothetical protein